MIQAPLCLLQILIHFLSQLYLENLSFAPPTPHPTPQPTADHRLDSNWIFSSLQDEVPRWQFFIYLFLFISFIFTSATSAASPPSVSLALMHAFMNFGCGLMDRLVSHDDISTHGKKNATKKNKEKNTWGNVILAPSALCVASS